MTSVTRRAQSGSLRVPRPVPSDYVSRMRVVTPYLEPVLAEVRSRRPIRTGSLIITVFGDILAPRGGVVWQGSLGRLLEPFAITYGQIRTAVSRLRAEEWLHREADGRRSFVSLTPQGRRRLEEAASRIYRIEREPWSGRWTVLLFPAGLQPRHPIRTALGWLGFGSLGPQVYLHPHPDRQTLSSVLDDARAQLPADAVPIEIDGDSSIAPAAGERVIALDRLVDSCWSFEPLEASYERFLARFGPVADALGRGSGIEPDEAVSLRIALIHDFRRILLRDPWLPPPLLPRRWIGREVQRRVAEIYAAVLDEAERWIDEHVEGPEGTLPAASPALRARLT